MQIVATRTVTIAKDHRFGAAHLPCAITVAVLVMITMLPVSVRAADFVARHGQRLSLSFHELPLKRVIQRLQLDAQITVKAPPSLLERKVTVSISNMAVDQALATLFKSAALNNFAIVHEAGTKAHITVVLAEDGKSVASARAAEPTEGESVSEGAPITPEMRAALSPPAGSADDPRLLDPDSTEVTASGDYAAAKEAVPAFVPAATEPAPPDGADLPHGAGPSAPGVEGAPITNEMRHMLTVPGASGH